MEIVFETQTHRSAYLNDIYACEEESNGHLNGKDLLRQACSLGIVHSLWGFLGRVEYTGLTGS